jgi:hypothetical protein
MARLYEILVGLGAMIDDPVEEASTSTRPSEAEDHSMGQHGYTLGFGGASECRTSYRDENPRGDRRGVEQARWV